MSRPPKPLSLPETGAPSGAPVSPSSPDSHAPRALTLPTAQSSTTPAVPQRAAGGNPRSLRLPGQSDTNAATEALIQRAISIDPTMVDFRFRLKGRFDTLLTMNPDDYMDWGERNLVALREVSAEKAKILARVSQIDATGWIERTQAATCHIPSFMDRFRAQEGPQYYMTRVQHVRTELATILKDFSRMIAEISPDAEDLRMDAMALNVFAETIIDTTHAIMAQNRHRTIVASQQTVVMSMAALEQAKVLCITNMSTIDQLLSVTIPNWQIAQNQR